MRGAIIGWGVCLALLGAAPSRAADATPPPAVDLGAMRAKFGAYLEDLHEVYTNRVQAWRDDYDGALTQFQRKVQAAGQLEELLAVQEELARLRRAHTLEPKDIVSTPPALAALQQDFARQTVKLRRDYNESIVKLGQQYVARLNDLQVALTRAGDLQAALAAKAERERALEDPAVSRAQFELAVNPGSSAPAVAGAGQPGAAPPEAPALNLAAGLVLHYTFDHDEGSLVRDQSGNGHTATVVGAAWTSAGVRGGAMSFDGAQSYLRVVGVPSVRPEGTVALFFKARRLVHHEHPTELLSFTTGLTPSAPFDGMDLGADKSSDGATPYLGFGLYSGVRGTPWKWANSGILPEPGRVYHLVGTWGPGGLCVYVNGALRGTYRYSGASYSRSLLLIGRSCWPDSCFDGIIDDVRMYNRALPADAVAKLYTLREPAAN